MKPEEVTTYEDLTKLTVPKLRELAAEDTELTNTTALEKPKQAKPSVIQKLKKEMRSAKKKRDELLGTPPAQRDQAVLSGIRLQMKRLKRQMRKLARAS